MKLGSFAHLEKIIFNCFFAKYVKTYLQKYIDCLYEWVSGLDFKEKVIFNPVKILYLHKSNFARN